MPHAKAHAAPPSPARNGRRPALFLDRDGVINVDRDYVHRAEQIEFVDGIFDLVRYATGTLGWPVIVVTNQSGIGRGLFSEADYQALTGWLQARFAERGAPINRFYHCPFHPEHGLGDYKREHPGRKPNPGMLLEAAADLGIDLAASALIGDRASDMAAGAAAGIGLLLGFTPKRDGAALAGAHAVIASLAEAQALIGAHAVELSRKTGF